MLAPDRLARRPRTLAKQSFLPSLRLNWRSIELIDRVYCAMLFAKNLAILAVGRSRPIAGMDAVNEDRGRSRTDLRMAPPNLTARESVTSQL